LFPLTVVNLSLSVESTHSAVGEAVAATGGEVEPTGAAEGLGDGLRDPVGVPVGVSLGTALGSILG
jgi:hypothetical protein